MTSVPFFHDRGYRITKTSGCSVLQPIVLAATRHGRSTPARKPVQTIMITHYHYKVKPECMGYRLCAAFREEAIRIYRNKLTVLYLRGGKNKAAILKREREVGSTNAEPWPSPGRTGGNRPFLASNSEARGSAGMGGRFTPVLSVYCLSGWDQAGTPSKWSTASRTGP